jgi:hypothetical protein
MVGTLGMDERSRSVWAAKRNYHKAGGLKFRFLWLDFLPRIPPKTFLPSSLWLFSGRLVFSSLPARSLSDLTGEEVKVDSA